VPLDTPSHVQAVQDAIFRNMSDEQKLGRLFELSRLNRYLIRERIRSQHPEADDRCLNLLMLDELYGDRPADP
jgi:hypothetical protein